MRKPTKTSILRAPEVAAVTEGLACLFGADASSMFRQYAVEPEAIVRFLSLAEKCRTTREAQGLTIKQVAASLGVAQYRLREIESAQVGSIRGAILQAYVHHLGIRTWYRRWAKENRELHSRLAEGDA